MLVKRADERWLGKESLLEKPKVLKERSALGAVGRRAGTGLEVPGEVVQDVPRGAGWEGEVRAREGRGLEAAGGSEASEPEAEVAMQVPDHKRHHFNERPDGTRVKEKKDKDDPWKQARGAPSEDWQPAAWSPSSALKR